MNCPPCPRRPIRFGLLLVAALVVACIPLATYAATTGTAAAAIPPPDPGTQVDNFLSSLYFWFLGFAGISALFGIVYGGVLYMFSGASLGSVENAKKQIWNAIFGIILAAAGVLLLYNINPDLVTHGFDINAVIDGVCGARCAP